jgi:hypothetical protein
MTSTHKASHGLVIAIFAGNFPYLDFLCLFTWQL